jgi:hypothetical protein
MSFASYLYGSPSNSVTRAEAGPSQAAVGTSSNACAEVAPEVLSVILFQVREHVLKSLESEDLSRLSCCSQSMNEAVCPYRCEKPVQLLDETLECDYFDFPEKVKRVFNRALKEVKTLTVGQDVLVWLSAQSLANLSRLNELTLIFSDASSDIKNDPRAYLPACGNLAKSLKRVVLSFDSTRYVQLIGQIVKSLPDGLQELKFVCGHHDSDIFGDVELDGESCEPPWSNKDTVELDESSIRDFTCTLADLPSSVKKVTVSLNWLCGFKSLADVDSFIQQLKLLPKNLACLGVGVSGWKKSTIRFLEAFAVFWEQFNELFDSLDEMDLRITGGFLPSRTFRRLAEGFPYLGSKSVRVVKISLHEMTPYNIGAGSLAEQNAKFFLRSFNSFPSCVKELHLCFTQWNDPRFESQLLTQIAKGFKRSRRENLEKLFLKIDDTSLEVADFDFFGKNLGALPRSLDTLVFDFSPWYILSSPNHVYDQRTGEVGPAEVVEFIAHFGRLPKNLRCLKFYFTGSSEHFEDKDRRKVKGARISEALRQIPSFLDEIEIIITFDHKTVITKENLQQKIESFSLLQDEDFVL